MIAQERVYLPIGAKFLVDAGELAMTGKGAEQDKGTGDREPWVLTSDKSTIELEAGKELGVLVALEIENEQVRGDGIDPQEGVRRRSDG
jgi:hypothetical protein